MSFINSTTMVANSAIVNPGMIGGNVWRSYKSIDVTPPVYAEPAPTSAY